MQSLIYNAINNDKNLLFIMNIGSPTHDNMANNFIINNETANYMQLHILNFLIQNVELAVIQKISTKFSLLFNIFALHIQANKLI